MSEHCQRCGDPLNASIVSRFNTDVICLECEARERAHPRYSEAVAAERRALESGDRNFCGIGLPDDLTPPGKAARSPGGAGRI
jgi:recombinational DNA repair protein (RecF pathway)